MPKLQAQKDKKGLTQKEAEQIAEEDTEAYARNAEKGDKLKEELDDLLDEIDEVLEENAEEFVRAYRQQGGQ